MKVYELAKELGTTPKELIAFFRENGYKVSSHMQKLDDESIDFATKNFVKTSETPVEESGVKDSSVKESVKNIQPVKRHKSFSPDEEIPCKSVTPWKLTAVGVDKNTVYHWEYFGDIEYIKYRDLQALRRTEYVTKPSFIILDEDLVEQWKRELGDRYKYFKSIDYPEEYFDMSDDDFEDMIKSAPDWLGDIIKATAMTMIRAENYPSIKKIRIIDDILGTCIKEFI